MEEQRFDGKVALVTGGASGIGRASALLFAQEGASVVVSEVAVEGGKEMVSLVEAEGGKATFVRADVSDAAEVEALIGRPTVGWTTPSTTRASRGLWQLTPPITPRKTGTGL